MSGLGHVLITIVYIGMLKKRRRVRHIGRTNGRVVVNRRICAVFVHGPVRLELSRLHGMSLTVNAAHWLSIISTIGV